MSPQFGQSRALNLEQINAVVAKAKTQDAMQKPKGTLWPSIADIRLILDAAKNKRKTVTLSEGRTFDIKYNRTVLGEAAIFISPTDTSKGFCPCGDFRLNKLEEYVTVAETV